MSEKLSITESQAIRAYEGLRTTTRAWMLLPNGLPSASYFDPIQEEWPAEREDHEKLRDVGRLLVDVGAHQRMSQPALEAEERARRERLNLTGVGPQLPDVDRRTAEENQ